MGKAKVTAPINRAALTWARTTVGMPLDTAAKKIGVKPEKLTAWESGQEVPSFAQLLKICEAYKRAPAVFFLESLPEESPPPKDFRILDDKDIQKLSPESLIELRRAQSKRESAVEIATMLGDEVDRFDFTTSLNEDPEALGNKWRMQLGATVEITSKWRSEYDAFNFWRSAIESLDVLVFQAQVESLDQFRGIAIYHEVIPIIILNTKDTPRGKMFSLLHEFCHILLKVSGIGNMEPPSGRRGQNNQIEVFCNAFAAGVLVPRRDLLSQPELVRISKNEFNNVTRLALNRLIRRYQASGEVILRRLLDQGLVTKSMYESYREELKREMARKKDKDEGGFAEWPVRRYSQNGEKFTSLVIRGAAAGVITRSDVSNLLGVKLNHLERIESLLVRRQK